MTLHEIFNPTPEIRTIPGEILLPYGHPLRPLTGERVVTGSQDAVLVRHWARKLKMFGDIQEVIRCIQIYAEANP